MLRWRSALAAALVVAGFAVAPGTASAQEQRIDISAAEVASEFLLGDELNVSGTGVCSAFGPVILFVDLVDLETGATANGQATTQCLFAGEHIRWVVTAVSNSAVQFRAGDRVNITATALDAINDTDEEQTTLKQFH